MDYRTLFFTYLASLTVYAAFACLLALRNRKVHGLCWIAGGLLLNLFKVILQGLEGRVPNILSSLVANELYFFSFIMQMLGLRWFVDRTPLRRRWPLFLAGLLSVTYAALYLFRIPYISNLINIPVLVFLGFTGWILLRRGDGLFLQVSRWTAIFVFGQMFVSLYRAVLTNIRYAMPWKVVDAQRDPHWLYSLMVMMFFTTCVVMCDLWFFVVELQRELILQSRTDALTGALNRRALYLEAEREISRSIRSGHSLCLLLFDIDDFKATNDTFGHAAGDLVLQRLVEHVNGSLRSQDMLARTGGEEFAILLPGTTSETATIVAERIRTSLELLDLSYEGTKFHISVSIGLAEMCPPATAFENVLQRADTAMYAAKRRGKNCIVTFENGITSLDANRSTPEPAIV